MAKAVRPNPEILKDEIPEHLQQEGFVVFPVDPALWPAAQAVWWDTARQPDYRAFVATAKALDVRLMLFFREELNEDHLEGLEEMLEGVSIEPMEYREIARTVGQLRSHLGFTGRVGIGFTYAGSLYWFEVEAPWFEEMEKLQEELQILSAGYRGPLTDEDEDEDEDPPMGNFYSRN